MLSGIYTHFRKKNGNALPNMMDRGGGGLSIHEFVDRDGPLDDNEPIHEW